MLVRPGSRLAKVPFSTWVGVGVILSVAAGAHSIARSGDHAQPGRPGEQRQAPWQPDRGDGTYRNPVLFADYSDPDVVRVGDDFYLIASSFNAVPSIPVLHSRDLVNWRIVGHVSASLPSPRYDVPQHGNGVWAPSLRSHAGRYWVYFGDPDLGIFMATAADPRGPWESMSLVKEGKGRIDPCPFWDDDGQAYLVHAWAKSRAGFNGVLTISRMSSDGRALLDAGTPVVEGATTHPTIEGPKLYKRNGYYYIFAPAGGVKAGWQTVWRSRAIFGPYEGRIVLQQGTTPVNGPHQGAWVDTPDGASWFVHFQDRGPYGRVVHLQPMEWRHDWPIIGQDADGDGIGEPVPGWTKPYVRVPSQPAVPQTSDEFDGKTLGMQWQWNANPVPRWASLQANPGRLRLRAEPMSIGQTNLWPVPSLLFQKFPAPTFVAAARFDTRMLRDGERAGLLVMGLDYAYVAAAKSASGLSVVRATCMQADKGTREAIDAAAAVSGEWFEFRVAVDLNASCQFAWRVDGGSFTPVGPAFAARPGMWIGARVGVFAAAQAGAAAAGHADVEFFRIQ
jgi:beta-xylosidase